MTTPTDNPTATAVNDGPDAGSQVNQPVDPGPADPNENPDPGTTSTATATPTNTLSATIQDGIVGDVNIASVIQEIEVFFQGSAGRKQTRIKLNEIWRITELKQTELAKVFVADQIELERLKKLLNEKRVLILSGEANLGKTSTAIYLAHSIAVGLKNGQPDSAIEGTDSLNTYMIPTPGPYDSIDWEEIWRKGKKEHGRFVIFQDAFADCNQDLLALDKQLREFSLGQFAEKLRKKNSYLVLTTATAQIPLSLRNTSVKSVSHELKPLSEQLLSAGLSQRLDALSGGDKVSDIRLAFLREPVQAGILIAELHTMPRLVRFVEDFVKKPETVDANLDLKEEIHRYEDISKWFQQELMADFEVWCFALSLGLVHWQRNAKEASWYEFEKVRRAVRACLKGDHELFPPRNDSDKEAPTDTRATKVVLVDDDFLEKCRAKIEKDPFGPGDRISFRDTSYPQKLWTFMLRHHRRVLVILLDHFREETEDPATDYATRALYAQIIGRIGEIDPDAITVNLITRWVKADEVRLRAAVAALYEGILASEDERYRKYLLDFLEALTLTASKDKEEKTRLLTSIAVYSRVGDLDLTRAMNGLKRIVLRKLARAMRDANDIQKYLERTENKFKGKLSEEDAEALAIYQKRLNDWATRMFNQQSRTFWGVQFALCSLALNAGPIKVFRELRLWIEGADQQTGALIALMFLFEDGISDTLRATQLDIYDDESSSRPGQVASPILLALTSDHESVVEMARFLVTLYESFTASFVYPKQFTEYLRTSLMYQLSLWIEEALKVDGCRKPMAELCAELIRIRNGLMFEVVYELLHNTDFLRTNSALKKQLAKEVFWRPEGVKTHADRHPDDLSTSGNI